MKRAFFIILAGLLLIVGFEPLCISQDEQDEAEGIKTLVSQTRIGPKKPIPMRDVDKSEEEVVVTKKQIKGRVSLIRPGYLSVIDKEDKKKGSMHAIDFRFDEKDVKLVRVRSLDEIKPGDVIMVECEEKRKEYDRTKRDGTIGKAVNLMDRKVTRITFMSKGDSRLSSDL